MTFSPTFYRTAAIASALSALTTLLLIFLPDFFAPTTDFAGRMARVGEPAYQLRSWTYFIHPFLTFTAALGVALRLRKHAAALVLPGLIGFALWAAAEAAQQTLTLFAFDRWRSAWLAGDAAVRATMEVRTAVYDGLWDAAYFLVLVAFLIGSGFFAAAMLRLPKLGRVVGAFYVAASVLTCLIISRELGGPGMPPMLDRWLYPAIQPLARVLIGVWLWRHADETQLLVQIRNGEAPG